MPDLNQAFDAINKNDATTRAILGQEQAEMAPAIAGATQTATSPKPTPPAMQKVPDAPKEDSGFGKDTEEWVGAMTALSGIVGAFSRQHATTALNAFSAGMQGFRQGKLDAMESSYKQWETSSKAAIENNKILQDQYKNILDDRKLTMDDQMNQIQLIAAKYKDTLTYQAASEKNYTLVARIIESQNNAAERLALANESMNLRYQTAKDKVEGIEEARKVYDTSYPKGMTGSRPEGAPDFKTFYSTQWPKMQGDGGAPPGGAGEAPPSPAGPHKVGEIIPIGDKKYKVIGGDPNDPELEEVK